MTSARDAGPSAAPPGRAGGNGKRGRARVHPFQVALRGGTAAERAALAERLARALGRELAVGRARFEDAGTAARPDDAPRTVATFFADDTAATRTERGPAGLFERRYALLDADLVLSEHDGAGDVEEGLPEVRLLAEDDRPARRDDGPAADVIATVGTGPGPGEQRVPHLAPADVAGLADVVRRRLLATAARTPLHGLVLAGGESTRMGRPKWALDYRGEPHARALHGLLSRVCERTFLSIRPEQRDEPGLADLPHVADRFLGMGPLGGILSAMAAMPDAAWIVLACDLPFATEATIDRLLARRAPLRFATTYRSPHDGMPEPLCAIYEPKARLRLAQVAGLGYACPRKMLMNARIRTIDDVPAHELTNANHPHEYERAVAELRAGGAE